MGDETATSVNAQPSKSKPVKAGRKEPVGLGGWLILPLLHVAVLLGLNLYVVVQTLLDDQNLFAIAAGGTDQLAAMRLPAALSLFAALLVIIPAAAGLYAMLVLSRRAPRIMFAFYLASFAATGFEASARTMMARILDERVDRSAEDNISTAIMCSVAGIVYFTRSRRVANTFGPRKREVENEVSETFA